MTRPSSPLHVHDSCCGSEQASTIRSWHFGDAGLSLPLGFCSRTADHGSETAAVGYNTFKPPTMRPRLCGHARSSRTDVLLGEAAFRRHTRSLVI